MDWPSLKSDRSGDVFRAVADLRRGNREGRGRADGLTDREKDTDSSISKVCSRSGGKATATSAYERK